MVLYNKAVLVLRLPSSGVKEELIFGYSHPITTKAPVTGYQYKM